MAKSRKLKMTDAVYRPHRNGERLPSQELVDRAVQEFARRPRIPQENPDPVLRVSAEHVLLYRNPAGEELCRFWDCRLGQKVPAAVQAIVSAALAEGAVARPKVTVGSHLYELTVVPSEADGYVNIYAQDITDRKRMKEEPRQHAEHLEERVEARTHEVQESERKDGGLVTVETSGMPVFAADGAFLGYTGIDRDVTSRKQAQEALREKEYLLSESQRIGHIGSWSVDLVTHSATWTRETYRLFGVAPDTFVPSADTLIGLLHPDDRDAMREWIRAALAGAPPEVLEFRVPLPDGSVRVLLGRGELIYADDHRPLRLVGTAQDVTERVQADESLRFTQFAIDHTADAAFWMTEEGRFFYVNEAACRALGYSRDELRQMTVYDIDPAFTESLWRESWRKLQAEKSIVLETVHRAQDGRIYPVEIRANYLEFGGRAYDCAFARDITERKRAEEEVAESRKRYRGLVEKINDWVWEIDADGVYTYSSPRARDLLGYPPEEILGKTPFDFMPPAEAQRVWNVLQPIWRERKPLELIENTLVRKDGSLVTVETSGMPMFAEDGAFLGYTGIDRDVTLRKQAQDALRESEQRYRRLIENLKGSHFIYRHDTTGVLTYVSESVTQVLGYTAEEGLPHYGKYFTDHPANQAAHQHTERTLQGIRQPPYEVNVWHKDGSSRWLEVQEVPVYDAGGKVVAVEGVAQDITERKRAQEALRRLNERLELQVAQRTEELRHTVDRLQQLTLELSQAEDRERRRIADLLHDDVQQTLAAAKFHLNLLSSEPRSAEESREIVGQVKRMLKDAIEKSRRLSHELSPALYQVDVTAILEWLARHIQEKHGLTVRVEVHGLVDSPAEPLKALLYKVVQELLFNVVKHAGVHEARIRVRRLGPYLYLSVIDRGRGFDPQRLETTPGFGLLGIRERVQLLGGRMKIKSAPGAGSTLLITLPYEPAARTQDAASPECQDASGTP